MNEINEQLFNTNEQVKDRTINDYLVQGEKVLWHGKPNAKIYALSKVVGMTPIAILWLFIDLTIIMSIFAMPGGMPLAIVIFLVVFFAIHLAPVWMWIGTFIKSKRKMRDTEYYITNKRVIVSNFADGYQLTELNIQDIEDVSLNARGFDKFVKVGDVTVSGGGVKITLYDIKEPEKIYGVFQKIKTKFKNLENLPQVRVCEYCGSTIAQGKHNCDSCGAVHSDD